MRFPIIKIKDNDTGTERIVGTDSHDSLLIENGKITYYNLQNGEGSEYGTYSFLGIDDDFSFRVEFVTFEKLQEIYEQEKIASAERKKERDAILAKVLSRVTEGDKG